MFALVTPSFNRIRNYLAESSSESEKEDADEEEEGMTLKKALSSWPQGRGVSRRFTNIATFICEGFHSFFFKTGP